MKELKQITPVLDQPCGWFIDHASSDIAISSRIRLARNIDGFSFPVAAELPERNEICSLVLNTLNQQKLFPLGWCGQMDELSAVERRLFCERSLMSAEHAETVEGSAFAVSGDQREAVMINEEDHLRLQVMEGGLNLRGAWDRIERLDDTLEEKINYAFHETFGYLTACPSNTGTGMRAGVMLHLPGLAMMEEIGAVMKGLSRLGCAVRGIGGEGSEADGFFYQVSNQITLGRSERDMIADLEDTVEHLISHERHARLRLVEQRRDWLFDRIGRAYGVLQNAFMLTSKEAMDFLGMLRLGLALNLLQLDVEHAVEELMLQVRPAHLQRHAGTELEADARDVLRARLIRSGLAEMKKADRLSCHE